MLFATGIDACADVPADWRASADPSPVELSAAASRQPFTSWVGAISDRADVLVHLRRKKIRARPQKKTTTGGHVTVCRQAAAVAVASFREYRQSSHTVYAREGGEERIAADHRRSPMVRRTGCGTRPFFGHLETDEIHLETDEITVTTGLVCC